MSMKRLKPVGRSGHVPTVHRDKTVSYWRKSGGWIREPLADMPEEEIEAQNPAQAERLRAMRRGYYSVGWSGKKEHFRSNAVCLKLTVSDDAKLARLVEQTGMTRATVLRVAAFLGLHQLTGYVDGTNEAVSGYIRDMLAEDEARQRAER